VHFRDPAAPIPGSEPVSEDTSLSAYRFLPGLIIVQVATAALVITAAVAPGPAIWVLVALFSLTITLVVGFWFASIADHARKDTLSEAREKFAQEHERLVVAAETANSARIRPLIP
jgi:hypothetical protein